MLKRRLAIVATIAAFGLAGAAGPALAGTGTYDGTYDGTHDGTRDGVVRVLGEPDDGPVRADGKLSFRGGRLTCWVDDRAAARKFSKDEMAGLIGEKVVGPDRIEVVKEGGVVRAPDDRLSIAVPAKVAGKKVAGKRWHRARVIHLTCVWDEPAR